MPVHGSEKRGAVSGRSDRRLAFISRVWLDDSALLAPWHVHPSGKFFAVNAAAGGEFEAVTGCDILPIRQLVIFFPAAPSLLEDDPNVRVIRILKAEVDRAAMPACPKSLCRSPCLAVCVLSARKAVTAAGLFSSSRSPGGAPPCNLCKPAESLPSSGRRRILDPSWR